MADFLEALVEVVKEQVQSGYYSRRSGFQFRHQSLKEAILTCHSTPIISEIKLSSPSSGELRKKEDAVTLAKTMEEGGAVGISVLTQPRFFKGSLEILADVKKAVGLPVLMKDFLIDPVQIVSALSHGADAVLLISSIFRRRLSSYSIDDMIEYAHRLGLEVLLEAHEADEYIYALNSAADLIGINNRNLSTMNVDVAHTERLIKQYGTGGKIVVSESGFDSPQKVAMLGSLGVKAFLIGSSIMKSENVLERLKGFVEAQRWIFE